MTEADARLHGQMSRMENKPLAANPFPAGTPNGHAWAKGWNEIDSRLGSAK